MALSITEKCVNCWACETVCPSDAIVAASPHFLIKADACSECDGHYADYQCAAICPVEEAILNSFGAPINPVGSLTGVPAEVRLAFEQGAGLHL
ncbi:4Fe-4S ferredoxin, iron-sulfur binding domain protein [Magnetococcus marinus MC-1]|uniref:4Fe-4S ferredoxin, iron-sulfur binding domain protein n=1 Tax=Magnetococcus marinus (strain ATCC BAA-1437 / JCM 17883 / MC-1) TaxID=156889 RepID=A0L6X5_MAGMM|nr:4Fe-4S binding protein [Magnetococcus marinus]ABK43718.1 4Fe-4S ferredoxin, iron-sulfur binding domain protein [Magnetococcus marinus MC-1]